MGRKKRSMTAEGPGLWEEEDKKLEAFSRARWIFF